MTIRRLDAASVRELAMARLWATEAFGAVTLQASRIRIPSLDDATSDAEHDQQMTDARFFMIALRWLHAHVVAAAELLSSTELDVAVERFEQAILGDAKRMRDI